jgi:cytoskeletal protein CcmA (bactofilin family)
VSDVNTLVGRGSHFEGKMTFEGVVRIDGSFEGEIVSSDTLIIGEGAEVRAEMDVSTVIIYGDVYGNIRASNSIELHSPSHLVGNIITPSLVIDRGATFDGNCRMMGASSEWTGEELERDLEALDLDDSTTVMEAPTAEA